MAAWRPSRRGCTNPKHKNVNQSLFLFSDSYIRAARFGAPSRRDSCSLVIFRSLVLLFEGTPGAAFRRRGVFAVRQGALRQKCSKPSLLVVTDTMGGWRRIRISRCGTTFGSLASCWEKCCGIMRASRSSSASKRCARRPNARGPWTPISNTSIGCYGRCRYRRPRRWPAHSRTF